MKKVIKIICFLLVVGSSAQSTFAQDSFASFGVFNRVLLVSYADSMDQEIKSEVLALFKGMRKKIEGVEWVHIADLTKSSQGFEQAITITFSSKLGLEEYEKHEDHLRIQKLAPQIVKDFASYEYWEAME